MTRILTASRPATTVSLGAALLLTAFGGLLGSPLEAQAKAKPAAPAPIKALVATNLKEAGGSRVAVRLAKPAPRAVKVLVRTHAVTGARSAAAKGDFAAKLQWVTIAKGAKVGYFTPAVVNDSIDEPNERLRVSLLKSTVGATLPAGKYRSAIATILDDDAAATPASTPTPSPVPNPAPPAPAPAFVPGVTVSDASAQIIEGDAQNATARFRVTLSAPTTVPVTVPYALTDGSAIAALDFAATAPGALQFAPGITELTVDVPVYDDKIDEDTEKASFTLGAPTGATIVDGDAELTVFDDDAQPKMAMSYLSLDEGTAQNTTFPFLVKLSHPSSKVITMTTYTIDGSATSGPNCAVFGVDYIGFGPKVITFQPGETVKELNVKVCGDDDVEIDESFALPLTLLTNATTVNPNGIGMIDNDD